MDELAYSLNGENAHYGTPINVAAPGRIPGGSSSGSAVGLWCFHGVGVGVFGVGWGGVGVFGGRFEKEGAAAA